MVWLTSSIPLADADILKDENTASTSCSRRTGRGLSVILPDSILERSRTSFTSCSSIVPLSRMDFSASFRFAWSGIPSWSSSE